MVMSSANLASMRAAVRAILPNVCTNSRTSVTVPVLLEADSREHHLSGASALVRIRRWALTLPYGTDVARYDQLTIPGMGTYWVAEVKDPISYQTEVTALCWQLADASGTPVNPISANASVRQYRQSSEVGSSRRVRFAPGSPANTTPMGERLPDLLYTTATDTGWQLDDIAVLVSVDGFSGLPHPHRFRVRAPQYISEPPSYIVIELLGEGGGYET